MYWVSYIRSHIDVVKTNVVSSVIYNYWHGFKSLFLDKQCGHASAFHMRVKGKPSDITGYKQWSKNLKQF
jgi:hypothetical protein